MLSNTSPSQLEQYMSVIRGFIFLLSLSVLTPAFAETVLHRGNGTEPDTLDPHKSASVWENNIIADMFLGLTTDAANGDIIPGSAESWTVTDDGLVYTLTLRDGLLWSDGVPVTAEDAVFGFQRILDPMTAAKYASLLYLVKNAAAVNTGALPVDALGVRALDPKTVEITLENPAPFFPQLLAHYVTFPIPKHAVERYGDDWVKPGNMVSNGAYVLEEWLPNTHVKLTKNPKFYDAENVAIDTVYYYPIEDARTALKMFKSDELDMNITTSAFPGNQIDQVLAELPGEARTYPYLSVMFIPMNINRPPFDDIRVRKAVSMLVDREIINERVLAVGSLSAYSIVPPLTANYAPGPQVDFATLSKEERFAEAKRLLADAGYSIDNPLEFELIFRNSYDNGRRMSAIAAMLKRAGVIANIIGLEARISYARLEEKDYLMGDAGWTADYNDPYNFLYLFMCDAGPLNWSGYCDPAYDALMNQASQTLDMTARADLMAQAEQLMLDAHPVVPIDFTTVRTLISKRVAGFEDNIGNTHRTRFMSFVE